jgi:hypothetical protein
VERGDSSQTLRTYLHDSKSGESCLTDSTVSSAAKATTKGGEVGIPPVNQGSGAVEGVDPGARVGGTSSGEPRKNT